MAVFALAEDRHLTRHPGHSDSSSHYLNMEGAEEFALASAKKWYGLSPAGYAEPEKEAACPSHVVARKGEIFWCQVLLEDQLVGVQIELTSPLGFFQLVKVAENPGLWEQLDSVPAEPANEETVGEIKARLERKAPR